MKNVINVSMMYLPFNFLYIFIILYLIHSRMNSRMLMILFESIRGISVHINFGYYGNIAAACLPFFKRRMMC